MIELDFLLTRKENKPFSTNDILGQSISRSAITVNVEEPA